MPVYSIEKVNIYRYYIRIILFYEIYRDFFHSLFRFNSDRYRRTKPRSIGAPASCYCSCKSTVTDRRIETLSRKLRLDAARIRRKGSAISRSRTTHGKLRERQAVRWDLTQHFYARPTTRTSLPFSPLYYS